MAKKAPKTKKASGFARGAKKAEAKKAAKGAAKKPSPRSQVLPGMEQVRNRRLDNICEGIAQERSIMNAASVEEKSLIATALQVMQDDKRTIYKHSGVELVRVPGADKLRVKLTKDSGDAEVSGGTTRSSQDDIVDGSDPAPASDFHTDDDEVPF